MKIEKSLKRKNPWNDDYCTEDKKKKAYTSIYTKNAALSVSPFVVALVSYSGEKELNVGSGTIIAKEDDNIGVVFTSANLIRSVAGENTLADHLKVEVKLLDGRSFDGEICAHDFHLNIAAVRFELDSTIQTPTLLRHLDDSLDLNPNQSSTFEETSSQLQRNPSSITPNTDLIALGRYFAEPFDVMAASGVYSLERCDYDCKELLMSTCNITRCYDGGPIVNGCGEVVGITLYDCCFTPFCPINIACRWWEFYNRYGESRRPSLGMETTNFYTADLEVAEKIIQKYPSISKGVIVEKVISGSSAESAGLHLNDVIIQCAGKPVQSFLEYLEIIWDHIGHVVELIVARADRTILLHLEMMVT